jgi:reactive intermediate/imine deaminase
MVTMKSHLPKPLIAPSVAAPKGHYSAAVTHGGLLYVSGQLGVRADDSHTAGQPFADQARQALLNMLAILGDAGTGPENLVRVTAYIVGIENWPVFNRVYAEMLGDVRPARTVVPVPALHYDYMVEIDAIAALPILLRPEVDGRR